MMEVVTVAVVRMADVAVWMTGLPPGPVVAYVDTTVVVDTDTLTDTDMLVKVE